MEHGQRYGADRAGECDRSRWPSVSVSVSPHGFVPDGRCDYSPCIHCRLPQSLGVPYNNSFIYPNVTGYSFSFTSDGFFEQTQCVSPCRDVRLAESVAPLTALPWSCSHVECERNVRNEAHLCGLAQCARADDFFCLVPPNRQRSPLR